jgi:cytochrome P450
MALPLAVLAAAAVIAIFVVQSIYSVFFSPLARIPGPKLYALTSWRLAYDDWCGTRTRNFYKLHETYGPAVRVGPNEVSFGSLAALRTIYGAGSGFERTSFYKMFEVYGRKNMFTFGPGRDHAARKKMVANAYAKSTMLHGAVATLVEDKARDYLQLIEASQDRTSEIFASLHYFSLDSITQFLYGDAGATACLTGSVLHRALIGDIIDKARRKLSWFSVHMPDVIAAVYAQTGLLGSICERFLYPMQKPTTYTGIRDYARHPVEPYGEHAAHKSLDELEREPSVIAKLWKYHTVDKSTSQRGVLDDADIAAECADHLLAGIDTTSDTLMFLIWLLSRPENKTFQQKIIDEAQSVDAASLNEHGITRAAAADKLPYLDAVIKETLRLFPPLPGSEPRLSRTTTTIDGYVVPANTCVSISPFVLQRNAAVFKDPFTFNPDRWVDPSLGDATEMNRWFWAFSSGGRMCIGMHLAMAEMTTLASSIYRRYRTVPIDGFDTISPGITSRYEVLCDDSCVDMRVSLYAHPRFVIEPSTDFVGTRMPHPVPAAGR